MDQTSFFQLQPYTRVFLDIYLISSDLVFAMTKVKVKGSHESLKMPQCNQIIIIKGHRGQNLTECQIMFLSHK